MRQSTTDKQSRYLSQAVQLEEAVNPRIIRATMGMVSCAILGFIVWSAFTNINEMARAPGEVVPQGYQQVVQHLEGGIVREISVKEGQIVKKDQLLLTLDGAGAAEDLERAYSKNTALLLQEERLRSFIDGRKPDWTTFKDVKPAMIADQQAFFDSAVKALAEERQIVNEQISQKKRMIQTLSSDYQTAKNTYDIAYDLYARRAALNAKGYASDVQFLETKQRVNEIDGEMRQLQNRISVTRAEIKEFENRLSSLNARYADQAYEKLDQVLNEQVQNREVLQKLENRTTRLDVRAPTEGLVKGLAVNTVGAVVQPGQTMMEIVPQGEQLVVQVKIPPQHIGHLKTGQAVNVKFSSYDFSRYGSVPGKLQQISATTFSGENGERYYQGEVSLSHNHVGQDKRNTVVPGMTVMADIITGEKTILAYLLKPIHASIRSAFTER